ncbi:Single-stranded DNA-binding protein [Microbacterium esteraromaticum]|uniref:Single-stranded DNA-binding protein n=1 Tax=Microbacterium esteraromaticum TaxID=57043 RepID=A0A1R4IXP5_9MICO|nr:single-stranded DNA-binding protein [Microbacterium esteraromaticum]SJN24083.1 Single-stranded DNA-binding protein [Microbacterium esteraromaticum]
MSNDTVTIRGNVGTDPVKSSTPGGMPVVNFRVGSSTGYWDRRTDNWVETGTNWYAVSAFRVLADHAKASLRRGDAVIITGTVKLREWESNGRKGFSADLVADAIGHDLSRGTSAFVRTPRPNAAVQTPQRPASDDVTAADIAAAASEQPDDWSPAGLTNVGQAIDPDLDHEPSNENEDEPSYA